MAIEKQYGQIIGDNGCLPGVTEISFEVFFKINQLRKWYKKNSR
ncbi:hypothetical protein SFC55_00475 [Niallia taxi]